MKYIFLVGAVIGLFYIAAMQLLLTEVNNLKNVYANADVITHSVADGSYDTKAQTPNDFLK